MALEFIVMITSYKNVQVLLREMYSYEAHALSVVAQIKRSCSLKLFLFIFLFNSLSWEEF